MAGVGMYGSQGVIPRHELTLSAYGRVFFCLLATKLARGLLGGKGGDIEGALDTRRKKCTAHLVGNDTHIEAQINLDAGMEFELRVES